MYCGSEESINSNITDQYVPPRLLNFQAALLLTSGLRDYTQYNTRIPLMNIIKRLYTLEGD